MSLALEFLLPEDSARAIVGGKQRLASYLRFPAHPVPFSPQPKAPRGTGSGKLSPGGNPRPPIQLRPEPSLGLVGDPALTEAVVGPGQHGWQPCKAQNQRARGEETETSLQLRTIIITAKLWSISHVCWVDTQPVCAQVSSVVNCTM